MRSQKFPGPRSGVRLGLICGQRGDRHRDVRDRSDVGADEPARAHADDRDRRPVETHDLANRRDRSREAAGPVAVADHRHQWRAGLVVVARQEPAGFGLQAERVVVAAGDERAGDTGDRIGRSRLEAEPAESCDTGEELLPIGERPDNGVREALSVDAALTRRLEIELHELLRIADRKPPQHQRVDQTEDGGVGADAEREREDDYQGEARCLGEQAQRVAHVAEDRVERRAVALRADALFRLLEPAERQRRLAPCLVLRKAIAHLVGGGHFEKRLQLLIDSLLRLLPVEHPPQNGPRAKDERHAPSSTLVMANAMRSHLRRCRSSCFRPEGVSA
jgi:hypothetical protein